MKEKNEDIEMLGVKECAKFLGVSESLVRKMVFNRRLPYYKVGSLVKFSKKEIDDYRKGCRVKAVA